MVKAKSKLRLIFPLCWSDRNALSAPKEISANTRAGNLSRNNSGLIWSSSLGLVCNHLFFLLNITAY